jgi:flagellar biosynthesis/type III secretory pathway protein FliH
MRVAVAQPIRGLRLHRKPAADVPAAPAARWLLELGQREQQRRTDAAALLACGRAVQQALLGLPAQVNERLDGLAAQVVELGLAVARELLGQALDQGRADPTPVVVRCLRDCVHGAERGDLVVRLHPADLALVQQGLQAAPEVQEAAAAARFVGDASVPRGGVRAETGAGRLRYAPLEVFERMAAAIRREAEA